MSTNEIKVAVKQIASSEGVTELEAITMMQTGAAVKGDEGVLQVLCELKKEYY